jgi:hypothetical protein
MSTYNLSIKSAMNPGVNPLNFRFLLIMEFEPVSTWEINISIPLYVKSAMNSLNF